MEACPCSVGFDQGSIDSFDPFLIDVMYHVGVTNGTVDNEDETLDIGTSITSGKHISSIRD